MNTLERFVRLSTRKALTDDVYGGRWEVHEQRSTCHGFSLKHGWPANMPQPVSSSYPIVVTAELHDYLGFKTSSLRELRLPISSMVYRRLRRLMGLDFCGGLLDWYYERYDELGEFGIDQFALKHRADWAEVLEVKLHLYGDVNRKAGWWRMPENQRILRSGLPVVFKADLMSVSVETIRRMISNMKQCQSISASL